MPDEVILDVTTIEENVTVETTAGDVVGIQVVAPTGPAGATGPAGPNSVTSATTSDGTANLSLGDLEVVGGEIYTDGDYSQIYTQGTDAHIFTLGSGAEIFTVGAAATIATQGENATISTAGANAGISTTGANAPIGTLGTNAGISTTGSAAHIQTSHASAAVKSTNFAAVESGGASLVDGSMQPCLTWSAGGRNLTIPSGTATTFNTTSYTFGTGAASAFVTALGTFNSSTATALQNSRNIFGIAFNGTANVAGDATNTGHFASIPTGGQAGHFVTLNGTAPTVIAGRSAWWSDGSGNPSFRNGTGTAVTLVKSSDLGTNVANFLEFPTSANLASALSDETGSGSLVFATSPTLTTPTIAQINGGTAANDDLTLQGTTNATRTTSYVILQPNGGNVGIGTATPSTPLYIYTAGNNSLTIEAGTGDSQVTLRSGGSPRFLFGYEDADDGFRIYNYGTASTALFVKSNTGNVGIGTTSPNAAAAVDVTSTTKGFLPPRMTTTQRTAIASPPAGLMIYNTTSNKLNVYNGTAWEVITSL